MSSEKGVVVECHTKAEFDAQMAKAKDAGKVVIIDFIATWCGPCRIIAPLFVEFAKNFPDTVFLKVDVDTAELKDVVEAYKVQAMPTFHFVKNGETVETLVGANKKQLETLILKHAASASA